MQYSAHRIRLSRNAAVRLALTAIMGLVLAVMVLLSTTPATAQTVEHDSFAVSRDEIVSQLDKRFQEAPVAGGIASNGTILEVFATPDGRTWTIIMTRPDGRSTVIAEGEGWSFIKALEGLRV